MGNDYGNAYATLRKSKKTHTVSREELDGKYNPNFVVASSFPKRLEGEVHLWDESWEIEPLEGWVDTSRVKYTVSANIDGKWVNSYSSYNINDAIEFYNNF